MSQNVTQFSKTVKNEISRNITYNLDSFITFGNVSLHLIIFVIIFHVFDHCFAYFHYVY